MSNNETDPYRSPQEVSEAGQTTAGWSLATKALIVMGVFAVLLGAGFVLLKPVAQFSEMNRAGPPIEIMEEDDYSAASAVEEAVVDDVVVQDAGAE